MKPNRVMDMLVDLLEEIAEYDVDPQKASEIAFGLIATGWVRQCPKKDRGSK